MKLYLTSKNYFKRNKSAFKCSFNSWKNKWRNGTKIYSDLLVFIQGTVVRTFRRRCQKVYCKENREISKSIANAYNCDTVFDYHFMYPVVMNDENFTNFYRKYKKSFRGRCAIEYIKEPSMSGRRRCLFFTKSTGTFFLCFQILKFMKTVKFIHIIRVNLM